MAEVESRWSGYSSFGNVGTVVGQCVWPKKRVDVLTPAFCGISQYSGGIGEEQKSRLKGVFPACVSPADDELSKSPNRIEDQSIFQDYQAVDYVTVHSVKPIAIRKSSGPTAREDARMLQTPDRQRLSREMQQKMDSH